MSTRYLYNSHGDYVAFINGQYVFDPEADWIGVIVNGNEMYSQDGRFVGYVMDDDRVIRRRSSAAKPRIARMARPARPPRPSRPIRRLRMARLPYPFEDVFEHGPVKGDALLKPIDTEHYDRLLGCDLIAHDGHFLGRISKNAFDQESLTNSYGPYGNPYQAASIFNQYGTYGNPYNLLSPFNRYTTTPPKIVCGGNTIGYLTVNMLLPNAYNAQEFLVWLKSQS